MAQTTLDLNLLDKPVTSVFARHETFHPRWGWLKKGFDAAKNNSNIFLGEDAPIKLGVGKNMVAAIRYWCRAFKITNDDDTPSKFGEDLLGINGWDTYLENPASLWLLHWNLLKPICTATAWYYSFNIFNNNEFKREDLLTGLSIYQKDANTNKNIAESSLLKDITCILRMYVEEENNSLNLIEESINSPFVELGLIYKPRNSPYYRFRFGSKPNLPAAIIVATCLEYAGWISKNQTTISIARLLYDKSSPGSVFKLSEAALCDAIEKIALQNDSISLSDTAGLIQLSFRKNPHELGQEIISNYYQNQ